MEDKTINGIIQQAMTVLEKDIGLAKTSLESVASCSFKPAYDYFREKQEAFYNEGLIGELDGLYLAGLQSGSISRCTYSFRTRGTMILREVYNTGSFVWKVSACKGTGTDAGRLPESFERIIAGIACLGRSEKKNCEAQSITRRFLQLLSSQGINDVSQASPVHIQMFLGDISKSRAKSMDAVITSLRRLDGYLVGSGGPGLPYAGLLMAPRVRERKIYPAMPLDELGLAINAVDRGSAIGKRDYAILLLAASSGIRAGDISKMKLSDIDWYKKELHILQGKTQAPASIPLQRMVGAALADYILNGRPESVSPQIFLRSCAPFQGFKDGTSVACALGRWMKAAGLPPREAGDGRTMHGIRRMLGTQMTMEGVPITTTAQVLGHKSTCATRQYISLDIEGLRGCALGFSSIGEGQKR